MRAIVLVAIGACAATPPPLHPIQADLVVPASPCPAGKQLHYLGFEGTGGTPPTLDTDVKAILPDRIAVDVAPGRYAVLTERGYDTELRSALEAAAQRSGWAHRVVDWGMVSESEGRCSLHFVNKY